MGLFTVRGCCNTLHEPFKSGRRGMRWRRARDCMCLNVLSCVCVCERGGVSVAHQTFILSPQLNPHQAADSGSLRSGGELATRMKKLTLFARTLPPLRYHCISHTFTDKLPDEKKWGSSKRNVQSILREVCGGLSEATCNDQREGEEGPMIGK